MSDENQSKFELSPAGFGWVVWVNSDLTEGRGFPVVLAVCETEATALRLARRADTQGSDGVVRRTPLFHCNGELFGPVRLTYPTRQDITVERTLQEQRAVEARARALGLTDQDLELLRRF